MPLLPTPLKYLLVFLIPFVLTACQSAPKKPPRIIPPELKHFPADVRSDVDGVVDLQLALADRDLYLSGFGDIKMLKPELCPIEVSAHRGDFRRPESSREAIIFATTNNYDSIEIDVMLLRDDTWVNFHDPHTGRAAVHVDGEGYQIERMDIDDFVGLRLRDKETGEIINARPITAYEAFSTFAQARQPHQKLNVEIKSDAERKDLAILDYMLKKIVGAGAYYYSASDIEILETLREIDHDVYLGLVQQAQPSSVDQLVNDLRRGTKNDAYYRYYQNRIENASEFGRRYYRNKKFKDYRNSAGLRAIAQKIGPNAGLHLDIRGYAERPYIKGMAHQRGIKVLTYTINGTDYHQSRLLRLPRKSLPDGVIVDTSPYRICQLLYPSAKPRHQYQPTTVAGKYVSELPQDADFDRFLSEMTGYYQEGYYINMKGDLRRVNQPAAPRQSRPVSNSAFQFPDIKDGEVNTEQSDAILIQLPGHGI
ncbi:glycerophosphodiester phosphodiesterase [Parendozoicomonas haliclonae]|uniref:Glycerophosphoryl diester phosphodiesterase family protein n=1 Tax=Parendozoicomonas haliclonae TaxID=1960125 RepID=A0A1X7ARC8_9GAMM|nr:glycerophosphodiester phosphodiesterase family protein [Parendozoicomonas haliclonae]SMA49957.1 Glycerophosphoryl diester phosphodiesterase family protein [Parendozoicomonas haliclonae]